MSKFEVAENYWWTFVKGIGLNICRRREWNLPEKLWTLVAAFRALMGMSSYLESIFYLLFLGTYVVYVIFITNVLRLLTRQINLDRARQFVNVGCPVVSVRALPAYNVYTCPKTCNPWIMMLWWCSVVKMTILSR